MLPGGEGKRIARGRTRRLYPTLVDAAVIVALFVASPFPSGLCWQHAYSLVVPMAVVIFILVGRSDEPGADGFGLQSLPRQSQGAIRTWLITVVALFVLGYATKTSAIFSRRLILTWII